MVLVQRKGYIDDQGEQENWSGKDGEIIKEEKIILLVGREGYEHVERGRWVEMLNEETMIAMNVGHRGQG